MSPRQLLEKLENLGIIDPKTLAKIRLEIENPEKTIKPKAILSYLVKKNQITEKQAARLLKAGPKQAAAKADEIEVVQPIEKSYDTDDLTNLEEPVTPDNAEPKKEASAAAIDPGATMMDDGLMGSGEDDVVEVQPEMVVSQAFEPAEIGQELLTPSQQPAFGAVEQGGFESGGYPAQTEQKATKSFRGKIDKSDQWSTKWLYIGFGILGTLLIGVPLLFLVVGGQNAEDMFEAANNAYNKNSWPDAAKKFEQFLEKYPDHDDSPAARAKQTHSIIRGTFKTNNWGEVFQQCETLLPPLEEDGEKLSLFRDDLGFMLPTALLDVSQKATKLTELDAMKAELVTINRYKSTMDKPQYISTSARKKPSIAENLGKIENNIKMVNGQIEKETRYGADLTKIKQLGQDNLTAAAFAVYQKLIRNYGDLASRKELRDEMLIISQQESKLVKPAEVEVAVSAEERPSLIQKSVTLATRSGKTIDALKGEIIPFLADGSVYGIDAGEGLIVWRRHVGFVTNIQPQAINDDFLAITNQQDHALMSVEKDTGELEWRVEIGEPFAAPTVSEKNIVVTTNSGKIIQLDSANGEIEKSAQLPRQEERLEGGTIIANTGAMVATRDSYIYQTGYADNLYVISSEDYLCKEVYYLGHAPGSIAIPPLAWQSYIIVCINGGDFCDLLVLQGKNGKNLKPIQMFRIADGPVTTPIQRFGRWMLVNSDNGQLKILELSPNSDSAPVTVFGPGLKVRANQPTFTLTEGSNMWVADRSIARCKVQRNNNGNIDRPLILEPNDTFISPMRMLDDYIFHVRRRNQSGMISASLVDSETLKPVWRADVGGELAGSPTKYGDNIVAVSNQGDMFSIDPAAIQRGYAENPVRASTVVENLKFKNSISLDNDAFVSLGPKGRKDILYANGKTMKSQWNTLASPADNPACLPVVVGKDLIVPSATGFVARVNPVTGQLVGTPFQPEVRPGSTVPWFEPSKLSETTLAVAAGALEDGSNSALYILDAANPSLIKEIAALQSEAPFRSRLVNDGNRIFGVITKDGGDQLAAISKSAPVEIKQLVELDGDLVAGPWLTEAGILVQTDNDELYCFGTDLSPKWSLKLENDQMACDPQSVSSQLMLTLGSGKIMLIDPSSGKLIRDFDLGQPIIHEPYRTAEQMFIAGRDGTVHVIDLSQLSQ